MRRLTPHAGKVLAAVALLARPGMAVDGQATRSFQWLESRVNQDTGLVDAFDDGKDSAPLYANCLAAMVFTHAGRPDLAAGSFSTLQDVYENSSVEGRWCQWGLFYDQRPATGAFAGSGDFRTGENAWLVMAINYFESLTGDQRFSGFATNLLEAICLYRDSNTNSLSYGAFRWGGTNATFCTEFQLDIYSALAGRGTLTGNAKYLAFAEDLRRYLLDNRGWPLEAGKTKVWLPFDSPVFNHHLYDGSTSIVSDCQAWAVLCLHPPRTNEVDFTRVLASIDEGGGWDEMQETVLCDGISVTGFSDEFMPGGTNQEWVWLEGTEFVSAAYRLIGNTNRSDYYHNQVGQLLTTTGTLYHSCANDGAYPPAKWPENYRFPSATTICWYYFVENGINPFQPPAARPAFHHIGPLDGGRLPVAFSSVPGATYRLWSATNLLDGNPWTETAFATNLAGVARHGTVTGVWSNVTVFVDTGESRCGFFRVGRQE